jgi:hypothetical protein
MHPSMASEKTTETGGVFRFVFDAAAVAEVEPKFRCGGMNYYYAKLANLYATTPTY